MVGTSAFTSHSSGINRWCYRRACRGMKEELGDMLCTRVWVISSIGSDFRGATCKSLFKSKPDHCLRAPHDGATPSSLDLMPPGSRPTSPISSTTTCCCQRMDLTDATYVRYRSGCSMSLLAWYLTLFRCRGTGRYISTKSQNIIFPILYHVFYLSLLDKILILLFAAPHSSAEEFMGEA